MKKNLRIALIGASGKMGQAIQRLAPETKAHVSIAISSKSNVNLLKSIKDYDVIIDVSSPKGCLANISTLANSKNSYLPPLVIGSTGWTAEQLKALNKYRSRSKTVLASNFSPAVNLFFKMLEDYGPVFHKLGYECSVFESHHNQKKDAPSGTAKSLMTPLEKQGFKPQVGVVRAGKIVGTHTVSFIGPEDIFEIRHEALNRDLFARGAILAAQWLHKTEQNSPAAAAEYKMSDVLFG